MILRAFLAALLVCVVVPSASAHEVRPALLRITQQTDGRYEVLWKQPAAGALAVRLVPRISGGLLDGPPAEVQSAPNAQISVWKHVDAGKAGLDGRTISVEGLEQTITDVLLTVTLNNGDRLSEILKPEAPTLTVQMEKLGLPVLSYVTLGIEHILTGIDHLMFVLGLVLLVSNRRTLIKTITAFTVAHSLTLAAATLGVIHPTPALVEALVALSIVFVAVELTRHYRGFSGLTVRTPWLIAFTFGLLHGAAFAGALAQVGLPPNDIPLSLLLFNIGVEIGQLLFVAAVLAVIWLLRRAAPRLPAWTRWIPPYAVGSFASFWFLERLQAALAFAQISS